LLVVTLLRLLDPHQPHGHRIKYLAAPNVLALVTAARAQNRSQQARRRCHA
jgi:hypothetical protein